MRSPSWALNSGLLSLEQLQDLWVNVSNRYFGGRLPAISIEWSSRLTASTGMFVSRVGPRDRQVPPDFRHGSGRVIRLSARLLCGQTEEEVVRTLAHEMIHQWQFDIRHSRPSHGHDFHDMMHRMNQDGLGISVYHGLQETVQLLNRYGWHCTGCGFVYHRQRRTIVPSRHRCGRCGGRLIESELEKLGVRGWNEEEHPSPGGESPILDSGGQLSFQF